MSNPNNAYWLFLSSKKIMVIPFFIILTLIITSCCTKVYEKEAFEQAAVAIVQNVIIPSPSLVEAKELEEGWESAMIGEAQLIYDINGKPFLYSFPVMKHNDDRIGSIWVAADKSLGSTIISIRESPAFLNYEEKVDDLVKVLHSRYPDHDIGTIFPVIYRYPRTGFMTNLKNPITRLKTKLILDYSDFSEAPVLSQFEKTDEDVKKPENFSVSFFDNLSDEEKEYRISQWNIRQEWDKLICNELKEYGSFPEGLRFMSLMDAFDLIAVSNLIYSLTSCEIYTIRKKWPCYCQSGIPYCAASIGRNIAGYYGKTHSEAKVAQLMNITKQNWPTISGELAYYKSTNGLDKAGSEAFTDGTAQGKTHLQDWQSIKDKLKKDEPFLIPSSIGLLNGQGTKGPGGWYQPGHWNALGAIKICKSKQGTETVNLYFWDPYPPTNCAGGSWESFSYLKNMLRSHTIPQEPGESPVWPDKPTFDPGKCQQDWYKILYPYSCSNWEDLMKKVGLHHKKDPGDNDE